VKKWLAMGLILCLLLSGCGQKEAVAYQTLFCMDTVMDIRIWGPDREQAMADIVELLRQLEKTWSATDENSALSAYNRGEDVLDAAQRALLARAEELCRMTDGAFNPKLGGLVALWGFYDDQYRVPQEQEIWQARQQLRWDLGAVIKGYAGDLAVEILARYDVDRAILNLGGNIQTYGEKAQGEAWNVGIQNPAGGEPMGVLAVGGTMAVVTSGDYQRYFENEGKRYHHILDPKTGMPAQSGLRAVTVICTDGMLADALSTALFVMGLEKAVAHWQEYGNYEAVFLLEDGRICATPGAVLTGCEYEVIDGEN
jgi:thiamine biosynthesis lipoprotein